jgi:prephenate dehydrogenase
MNTNRKHIAIVGVGLIGGSLALRLHEKKLSSFITGVEDNEMNARQAMQLELVDAIAPLEQALHEAEVIALCVPVDALVRLLPFILDAVNHSQIVFDMGSTKQQLLDAVRNHPNRGRFVASSYVGHGIQRSRRCGTGRFPG